MTCNNGSTGAPRTNAMTVGVTYKMTTKMIAAAKNPPLLVIWSSISTPAFHRRCRANVLSIRDNTIGRR
ncbi:MAG TPA: hypothetical protein VGL93_17205 [Streptosporangiaceae bacterium]